MEDYILEVVVKAKQNGHLTKIDRLAGKPDKIVKILIVKYCNGSYERTGFEKMGAALMKGIPKK